ncbi:unnamed protein product [Jaminaea pallidilutea]
MLATRPSAAEVLSSHIHQSALLSAACHDVNIIAFGRLYRLHRIFLIQSSFFASLLQGGFSEGASYVAPAAVGSHSDGSQASHSTLRLNFDDPNITRPAFEYCIALLYGANPELVLPTWANQEHFQWPPYAQQTAMHEMDERLSQRKLIDASALPVGTAMPATPRFLVSLVATSIYLGIPRATYSALTLVLTSLTPYTVSTFLRFALGKPILGAETIDSIDRDSALWDWEIEGPCWGLNKLGHQVVSGSENNEGDDEGGDDDDEEIGDGRDHDQNNADFAARVNSADVVNTASDADEDGDSDVQFVCHRAQGISIRSSSHQRRRSASVRSGDKSSHRGASEQPFLSPSTSHRARTSDRPNLRHERPTPSLDYGAISHRLGEACFCYLARFGGEIAAAEQLQWEGKAARLSQWLDAFDQDRDDRGHLELICEGTAQFIVPRDQLPARCEDDSDGLDSTEGDCIDQSRRWDLPPPSITVFSHPLLSHCLAPRPKHDPMQYLSDDEEEENSGRQEASTSRDGAHRLTLGKDFSMGMTSRSMAELLGSDAFFTRSELERYTIARDTIRMRRAQRAMAEDMMAAVDRRRGRRQRHQDAGSRRRMSWSQSPLDSPALVKVESMDDLSPPFQGTRTGRRERQPTQDTDVTMEGEFAELDEDDVQYMRLFEEGIYYSHLSFGDLNRISREAEEGDSDDGLDEGGDDVDIGTFVPSPGSRSSVNAGNASPPISAPMETLQAALWAGNELKNHILSSGNGAHVLREPGFGTSSDPYSEPSSIRQGFAYVSDGSQQELAVQPATFYAAGEGENDRADEATLGISSSMKEFAQTLKGGTTGSRAGQRIGTANVRGHARLTTPNRDHRDSRNSTGIGAVHSTPTRSGAAPSSPSSTPARTNRLSAAKSLGGLSYSPLTTTSGKSSLLSRRYYSIPVDDTIRYGEYFAGLLGSTGWGVTTGMETGGHEASGLATMRDKGSLPFVSPHVTKGGGGGRGKSTAVAACLQDSPELVAQLQSVLLGGPQSDVRRNKDNLFGLCKKFSRGRVLARIGEKVAHQKAIQGEHVCVGEDSAHEGSENRSHRPTESVDIDRGHRSGARSREVYAVEATHAGQFGQAEPGKDEQEMANGLDNEGGLLLAKLEVRRWTGYEPMRVGVEYFGLDRLEEKQRLYSPSFFYAGSVWNLYVQTVRKPKGTQLGIYLHRQSPLEPLPPASASPDAVEQYHANGTTSSPDSKADSRHGPSPGTSFLNTGVANRGAMTGTVGGGVSSSAAGAGAALFPSPGAAAAGGPPVLPGVSPPVPYRDPRKLVRAYFSIHCYSPRGNSLTRFDSGPDRFSESQSWGWKSSSLMGYWELPEGTLGSGKSAIGEEFRCVVTLGVV